MPILHCDLGGGIFIDALVHDSVVPHLVNGARLPDIPLDRWDTMSKAERLKMQRDYNLLSDVLTKAKIDGQRYRPGKLRWIGNIGGNQ